ncbi:unnamed protein product, partial [Gulo gulo]
GTSSQAVVTQEPSLTVSPGVTVNLTCSSSTGAVTKPHYPHCFHQNAAQVPRVFIYGTHNKYPWTPNGSHSPHFGAKLP